MPPRAGVTISGAKRLCIRDRSLLPQVCAQPRTSAVKVTLPAVAVERRAAERRLLTDGARYQSTSPARGSLAANSPHTDAAVLLLLF